MNQPHCQRCGAPMIWAKLPERGWTALDHKPREPRVGLIAYNPRTQAGHGLTDADLAVAWQWAYAGATFHPVHHDVCHQAQESRKAAGQTTLAL